MSLLGPITQKLICLLPLINLCSYGSLAHCWDGDGLAVSHSDFATTIRDIYTYMMFKLWWGWGGKKKEGEGGDVVSQKGTYFVLIL